GYLRSSACGSQTRPRPLVRAGNSSSSLSKGRLHSGSRFAAQAGVDVAPPDVVAILSMEGTHGLQVHSQWFNRNSRGGRARRLAKVREGIAWRRREWGFG